MLAMVVDDVIGWLPMYLRLFVLVAGIAAGFGVVQQRALEPLGRAWTLGSVASGMLAVITCIPGIWISVRAEDLPVFFAGPFLLLGVLGLWLTNKALTPFDEE